MTREDAIEYGTEWLKDEYLDAKDREFIKIAIKALKQEPCENSIIDKHYWKGFNNGIRTEKFRESKQQELCEDCVSRKAVLDIINFEDKWLLDAKGHNADTEIAFSGMKFKVSDLPPTKDCSTCKYCKNNIYKD